MSPGFFPTGGLKTRDLGVVGDVNGRVSYAAQGRGHGTRELVVAEIEDFDGERVESGGDGASERIGREGQHLQSDSGG